MNVTLLSRLRRARWVHVLHLLVFTCWVANPFPGAMSYWTDSNSDGVKEEVANPPEGDSWWDQDSDGDNLTNAQEALYGSDPYSIDSDHDGLRDDAEQQLSDPTAPFDPWLWDSNGNGFSDHDELYQRLQGYTPVVNYSTLAAGSFFSYSDADGDDLKNHEDSDPLNMDRDNDGVLNWNDTGYMDDPNNGYTPPPENNDPGVWIGGNWYPTGTMDSDGDGTPDQYDSFPFGSYWYNGMEFGGSWSDRDNDGIPDTADSYPDGSHWYNGVEYSGTMVDQDGDGVPDWTDPWPSVAGSYWYNGSEYPGAWNDQDGDGIPDPADPSPNGSYWWNGTEYLGAWVDQDGDGTPDPFDAFPTTAGSYWWNGTEYGGSWADADNDGTPDAFDATPNGGYWYNGTEYAGTWSDTDNDGVPDAADATPNGSYWYNGTEYAGIWSDVDNDGVPDAADFWMWDPWNGAPHFNYNGTDYAGDWIDRDNDTIPDAADAWPDDAENNADNDGDGLSNYAENTQHGTDPGNVDSDGEGLTDFEELYTYHTNPLAEKTSPNQVYTDFYIVDQTDSDGDQIPDRIEQWYAGQGYGMSANDANDALGDLDGDGYSNREAYFNGWNFTAHLNQYDNDADGILDVLEDTWSVSYPGILSSANFGDAVQDYDNDGLMNFEEVALGLNPGNASSRITGVCDLQEWAWRGIIYQTGVIACSSVPPEWNVVNDADNTHAPDGLESFVAALNANPAPVALPLRLAGGDYDGDGMPDVWEHQYHLNLRDAADAEANNDGDSLTNLQEFTSNPPRDPLINDDPPPPELTLSANVPSGAVGEAYTATFTASGGTGTYTYSLTNGTLPEGVSLDSGSGVISGTPTTAGTFDLWVQVSDSAGQIASSSYGLIIAGLQFVTETLPQGTVGADYTASISVAQGTAPYTFLLITQPGENGLPFGYTLQSNGTLTGIGDSSTGSQQAGTYTFTVQVNDNAGQMAERQFTLELNPVSVPPLSITTTALPPVGVGLPYAFTLQAAGGSEVEFSAAGLPPGMALSSGGSLSGTVIEAGSHLVTVTAQDHSGSEGGSRTCSATLTLHAALAQFTPTSGDEQLMPVGATLELSVRVTVAGVPQPWIMINMGSTLVMTDIEGVASANVTAPMQQGEFHVPAGFAGANFAEFSLYAYDMPPAPNPVPINPIPGPPVTPPITTVEDDEVEVESRWVSVSKGTLEASYSSGQAIGRVNGQWQVYQEDASGYANISRDKGQWKTSDGQSGEGDEPPELDSLPWEPGLAEGLHHHYQDTESGPVSLENEDIGNTGGGSSSWPEWTNGPGVIKYNGSWNGRSVDREKRITAEVRIKRKSGGGGGGSSGESTEKKKAFLRLIYEKPENGVETLVSSEVVYQTINPDGTVSNPPTKLNPEADKGKVRREVIAPIEVMQPKLMPDRAVGDLASVSSVRFCRWRDAFLDATGPETDGILKNDFITTDPDRVVVRLPDTIVDPADARVGVKVVGIEGVAGDNTEDAGVLALTKVGDYWESKPLIFVADPDDDLTYNGVAGEDGRGSTALIDNDQTRLAGFGATIQIKFTPKGQTNPIVINAAKMMAPLKTVKVALNIVTHNGAASTQARQQSVQNDFDAVKLIYRQLGYELVQQGAVADHVLPAALSAFIVNTSPVSSTTFYELDGRKKTGANDTPANKTTIDYLRDLTQNTNAYQLYYFVLDKYISTFGNTAGGESTGTPGNAALVVPDSFNGPQAAGHELGHLMHLGHPNPPRKQLLMTFPGPLWQPNSYLNAKRFFYLDAITLQPQH